MQSDHNRSIARGVGWMLLFKFAERSLGLLSTLILARLLAPTDFGVVAMVLAFVAMAQLLAAFGFDVALIRDQSASEDHYNTAWTLNAALGLVITLLMLALAKPISNFYGRPELFLVVCALSLGPFLSGLENIGVVAFRKDMHFRKEFWFQLSRKLIGILITVPLAYIFRNYWALVAGTLTSSLVGTVISFVVHPFRPHFSIGKARDLLVFSRWLLVGNLVNFARERSSDFFIGRLAGPAALGAYNIAYEISNLPTTELSAPINRALMPGFSRIANDLSTLQETYYRAFSLLALMAVPAAVGILATAHFLVPVVLGEKWSDAVPLVQMLAIAGVFQTMQSSSATPLIATGHPKSVFSTNALYAVILCTGLAFLVPARGANGAAIAVLTAVFVATPVFLYFLRLYVGIAPSRILQHLWRPVCAAALMCGAVMWFLPAYVPGMAAAQAVFHLMSGIVVGVVTYAVALAALWLVAGRPAGGEQVVFSQLRSLAARPGRASPSQ